MATTQSSDVMAVDEEKVESSLTKKRKADVEESEGESGSEDEELVVGEVKLADGRVRVFNGCLTFTYVPEPEPEWDVDSFDERGYESDPKVRAVFSDEDEYMEYRNERIQALESKGFLPDPLRYINPILNLEQPTRRFGTTRQYLANLALCVKKLNDDKKTTVEFVSVVRANISGGGRWKLYITFMARECPNGPLVEYQAKAMDFAGESQPPFPILCRPASKSLSKQPLS